MRSTPRRIATHPRPSPTLRRRRGSARYVVIAPPWRRPTRCPPLSRISGMIGRLTAATADSAALRACERLASCLRAFHSHNFCLALQPSSFACV